MSPTRQVAAPALALAGSVPYPWPYDGPVPPGRLAVLVVAAQQGAVNQLEPAGALASIKRLLEAGRAAGVPAVFVRHGARHPRSRAALPQRGSAGWELLAGLPEPGDVVVDAAGIDGFYGSDLDRVLRDLGATHLALAGLGLETFVHSTLRTANDLGYECVLIEDSCVAADAGLADAASRIVGMSGGIFGAVATSDALVDALASLRQRGGR
ncbi:MAG: isochorismatase family cysteine hydrolase [Acidimicrobiales bacterium]